MVLDRRRPQQGLAADLQLVRRQEIALQGFVSRCRKIVVLSPGRRRTEAVALFLVREDNWLASLNRSRLSMKINADLVVKLRTQRSWSQDELAIASGLNLRTIQRIEKYASASLQSKKALAAALDIDTRDLDNEEVHMKPCPVCGSNEIYQYKDYFMYGMGAGEELLPGLGSKFFSIAKIRPSVCMSCGHVRIFTSEEARKKLKASKHWKPA